jgi:hypothetical protein
MLIHSMDLLVAQKFTVVLLFWVVREFVAFCLQGGYCFCVVRELIALCLQGSYCFCVVRKLIALFSQLHSRFMLPENLSLCVPKELITLFSQELITLYTQGTYCFAVAWYLSLCVLMELNPFVFRRNFRLRVRKDLITSGGKIIKTKNMNSYRRRAGCSISTINKVTKPSCVDGWARKPAEVRHAQYLVPSENEWTDLNTPFWFWRVQFSELWRSVVW